MKRDWLQLLTNLGVVAGLVLLLWELNQSRDLTRAQVIDSAYDAVVFRNLALLLNTQAGRTWWNAIKPFTDPDIVEAVDEALAGMDPGAHRQMLERIVGDRAPAPPPDA